MARYRGLWQRGVAIAGSYASLVALAAVYVPQPHLLPWWGIALEVLAGVLFFVLVILELNSVKDRHVYKLSDKEGIRAYMHDWIGSGGRVAIWSRDLSWANNDRTKDLLRAKAGRNELVICVPHDTGLTMELRSHGATVHAHNGLAGNPQARFTIAQYGQQGARVAVGRRSGRGHHVIDEFSDGEHPAFHMAEDLVRLAADTASA